VHVPLQKPQLLEVQQPQLTVQDEQTPPPHYVLQAAVVVQLVEGLLYPLSPALSVVHSTYNPVILAVTALVSNSNTHLLLMLS